MYLFCLQTLTLRSPRWPFRRFMITRLIFMVGVLVDLEKFADDEPPDPWDRKVIFCNDQGITQLRGNDEVPAGSHKGRKVCKLLQALFHIEVVKCSRELFMIRQDSSTTQTLYQHEWQL